MKILNVRSEPYFFQKSTKRNKVKKVEKKAVTTTPSVKSAKFPLGFCKALFVPKQKPTHESSNGEAEGLIMSSPLLRLYLDETNKAKYYVNPFTGEKTNALLNLDKNGAIEAQNASVDIAKRANEIKKQDKLPVMVKSLLDLRFFDEEAYKYALQSDLILKDFITRENGSYGCIKNLTKAALIEIEKRRPNRYVAAYVNNSDTFVKYEICSKKLDEFLSQNTTEDKMLVKRVERHTGIFDEIPLDDRNLELEVKFANAANAKKTREAAFSGYTKSYFQAARKGKMTIYEYIAGKKKLSLADAMLVMPYLNKGAQDRVLEKIKGTKLYDDRFKSTTLSDKFVNIWLSSNENGQPQIENTITLDKGIEGRYVCMWDTSSEIADNSQFEFIINRGKKEMTITSARYDEEENLFYLESFMKKA